MIRPQDVASAGAAPCPVRRRAVVAVLTGSTRDVTVAREGAVLAAGAAAQLLLAVPVPAERFGAVRAELSGGDLPPQAARIAARIVPRLPDQGVSSVAVVAVPYPDRGDPSDRSRRIAAALVELCRRTAARLLTVPHAVPGELGAERLSTRLQQAAETGLLCVTQLVVVRHDRTLGRPASAVPEFAEQQLPTDRALPPPRPPLDRWGQLRHPGRTASATHLEGSEQ